MRYLRKDAALYREIAVAQGARGASGTADPGVSRDCPILANPGAKKRGCSPISAQVRPQKLINRRWDLARDGKKKMSVRNGFVELGVSTEGLRAAPVVSRTYWGYVLRPAEPLLERAALIELAALVSGIVVLAAAAGHWVLPGSTFAPEVLPLKLMSTVLFAALGLVLLWTARKGLVQEMHVDKVKLEVRLVMRNRRGDGREVARLPFSDVSAVVLRRSKTPVTPSCLALRLAQTGALVDILPSDAEHLTPLRDRLIADMSPRFRHVVSPRRVSAGEGAEPGPAATSPYRRWLASRHAA